MTPLTIGMATYDDYSGVYFSIQSLRLFHHEHLKDCEILVVDNNPNGEQGQMVKGLAEVWAANWPCKTRYIPFPEAVGTTQSRQRIFDEAVNPAVLCMDCHVLLPTGTIGKLRQWYTDNPESKDLITGPMYYDDLTSPGSTTFPNPTDHIVTQFDDQWRSEMWGIWGADKRGQDPNGPPFEVWGQGLGLFSSLKSSWLGFNPHMRGFGGEEGYIHTKYRQAGHKTLCLPFLRWLHRFGRPGGVPYPLTRWNKVRNYVLGHRELGMDLAPVYEHFVTSGLFSQAEWDYLVEDPVAHVEPKQPAAAASGGCGGCGGASKATLEELYERACKVPSDLNEHAPKLKELAEVCDVVVDIGHRPMVSSVAMLAGQPGKMFCYVPDKAIHNLERVKGETELVIHDGVGSLAADIPECDLLFLDTDHNAKRLLEELNLHAHKVRRWIVRHDTQIYGERGTDGGPGLLAGFRQFMRQNPEWSVVYHTNDNYGLTVISKDPDDKPELPPLVKQAWNYTKAILGHKISGRPLVTEAELDERLDICSTCEFRNQNRCSICGCFLDQGPDEREGKALWKDQPCPIGKWPELEIVKENQEKQEKQEAKS